MIALLFRVGLLTAGFAAVEVGLGPALVDGSLGGWLLVLLVGLPLIVAGSAGLIGPLLGARSGKVTPTMRKHLLSALLLVGALFLLPVMPVLADDPGAGISVEPADVTAGQTVLLAGNKLEPDNERVLVLQGETLAVSLGTATTDANGMLGKEILIPAHLPSGTYQLQAIGDETLQVELRVTAAAGGAAAAPEPGEGVVANRVRTGVELAAVVLAAAILAALGVVLVVRAERFRGSSPA